MAILSLEPQRLEKDEQNESANLSSTNGVAESAVLHFKLNETPPRAVKSEGCWITTADGQEIIDASSGAAVACVGHNNPRVKAAIARQLDEISYCYHAFFTTDAAEKLATELCASTHGHMSKAFITSSGTEAIEAALKLARQYFLELAEPQPERTHFIARRQSYHGNTLGALALGGHVMRKANYLPILSTNVSHVSPCYAYRWKGKRETDSAYVERLAEELEDEFQAVGPGKVCAFVAETLSGTTLGSVPAIPGYFKAMKDVCDRHGALLILDEVMSGMGRTGSIHAWEQEGVLPDLQTVAKGLGAGYLPIGALLASRKVMNAFDKGTGAFIHTQTYQGHPVACAAAYEVQRIVKEADLMANVRSRGTYLREQLRTRLGGHKNVGDIRGRGLFWAIEFVKDKETKEPFPADQKIAPRIHKVGLLKYGVSCIPGTGLADGTNGDMIQIAPAYIISEAEIDLIVSRIAQAIAEVLG